MRDKNLY